jgi:hypothetical protein
MKDLDIKAARATEEMIATVVYDGTDRKTISEIADWAKRNAIDPVFTPEELQEIAIKQDPL